MTIEQTTLLQQITDCYNYFQNNQGDTKPNATNSEGIPYHAFESGYHWQIHESSTTSECLSLMCRAMVEAGYLAYAKQLADYMINTLTHNNVNSIHWLSNLVDNGVEMESVFCGNYDNAVFPFVSGVGVIPVGTTWHGEDVIPYVASNYNGVRGCWTTTTKFEYKDYWVSPQSSIVEYDVDSYLYVKEQIKTEDGFDLLMENGDYFVGETSGTEITLADTTFSGNLQVYYGYRNGDVLNKDELYRTYPLNSRCIITPYTDYQLSCAVDAIQWAAIAFKKYSVATGDNSYLTKANSLMAELIANSIVRTGNYDLFNATNRGLTYFTIFTYDQYGNRNLQLLPIDKEWQRLSFNAGTGVIQWGVGSSFAWIDKNLTVKFKGDGSNNIRQIVITDATRSYYYAFLDDSAVEKILTIKRGNFEDRDGMWFEPARLPYSTPYLPAWYGGSSSYTPVNYNNTFEDTELINYAVWGKWDWVAPMGGGAMLGTTKLSGVTTTSESSLRITAASSTSHVYLFYKVVDANGTSIDCNRYIQLRTTPDEYILKFTTDYFQSTPVHPIQNIELYISYGPYDYPMAHPQPAGYPGSGTVYIAGMRISSKLIPVSPLSSIKFETNQTTAGHFDIAYATLLEGNYDLYPYSGAAVFSMEYYEEGLMNWRSGSYAGYTNPYAFTPGSNDSIYACKFIYDSQMAYKDLYAVNGPCAPVYLRNLGENLLYGTLGTWGWAGPDTNTLWAGFQYRAIENMADHRYYNRTTVSANEIGYCHGFLNSWTNYLYRWILQYDNLPSTFKADGTIAHDYDSPDFYAQVGRGMLLKYLIDWDKKSWYICNWCYAKLSAMQQSNGSFKATGGDTYNYHQAQIIMFLAALYNHYDDYKYIAGMTDFTWTPNKVYTASLEFRTEIFESFSGKEARTSETFFPIRKWRLKFGKNNAELAQIRAYINSLKGRYSQFNWQWKTEYGGDDNTYVCRLAEDSMVSSMQHLGFAEFELVFEAIDTNVYNNLTTLTEAHNIQYEQQEQNKTVIDDQLVANMAVNVSWIATRKRWNLTFQKNSVSRKWLENFFISQKGKYKEWTFNWSAALGGDGQDYQVRFDTDTLDFDISYLGFGQFMVPIIEVI